MGLVRSFKFSTPDKVHELFSNTLIGHARSWDRIAAEVDDDTDVNESYKEFVTQACLGIKNVRDDQIKYLEQGLYKADG